MSRFAPLFSLWMTFATTRYRGVVRWEELFADLEAQLAAGDPELEIAADQARAEMAQIALGDRLRAHVGARLRLRLIDGQAVTAQLVDVGADWLLVRDDTCRVLVPFAALGAVSGLSRAVAPPAGHVARRLRLPVALRALARDRAAVRLDLLGHAVGGTIDRVGADHIDLAEHPAGEPRRASAVREVLSIPLASLVCLRSTD